MDNVSASHGWSNGCESGWTVYLDESYNNTRNYDDEYTAHHHHNHQSYRLSSGQIEEEEDLSMVSDASSGPPHLQGNHDEESYNRSSRQNYPSKSSKKSEKRSKKSAAKEQKLLNKHQNQHSCTSNNHLDDTASSPAITYSQKMQVYVNPSCEQVPVDHYLSFSQSMPATHFQGNSSYSNHYSFWESSLHKDTHSAEPSHLTGRRWE